MSRSSLPPCIPQHFALPLSQDAFSLVASFVPLSALLVLRRVCRQFQSYSLHPHCYLRQSGCYELRSLDCQYVIALSRVHPHLRSLSLPFSPRLQVTEAALSFLFASFPLLSSLRLTACSGLSGFPVPVSPCSLMSLQLSSTPLPAQAFCSLSLLLALTSLTLSDCNVDDASLLLLSSSLQSLRSLDISQCPAVSSAGLAAMFGVTAEHWPHMLSTVRRHTDCSAHGSSCSGSSRASLCLERPLTQAQPLQRSMSSPLIARPAAGNAETQLEAETQSPSASSSLSTTPVSASSSLSPPSPLSPLCTASPVPSSGCPPAFIPSPLSLSLRSLSVAYNRQLSDALCLSLAYCSVRLSGSSCCCCLSCPAACCSLLPLQSLDLSFLPQLTDLSIACLLQLTHLSCLCLSHSPLLTDDSLLLLAELPFLSSLELCGLPRISPLSLSALPRLQSLSSLSLSSLPLVSDAALLRLASLPLLSSLSLSALQQVSDVSLMSLSASTSLQTLSLTQLAVTGRGLLALMRCRQLSSIRVSGCHLLTEEQQLTFRRCRPDVAWA